MCSKEILVALKNSYASTSIAEATFQMAQLSYRLGYDFGIDDELLFRFSKEASEKSNGGLADKSLDATFLLAEFLKRTGQQSKLKDVLDSQSDIIAKSDDLEAKKYWKELISQLSSVNSEPTPKKRKIYASVAGAKQLL